MYISTCTYKCIPVVSDMFYSTASGQSLSLTAVCVSVWLHAHTCTYVFKGQKVIVIIDIGLSSSTLMYTHINRD